MQLFTSLLSIVICFTCKVLCSEEDCAKKYLDFLNARLFQNARVHTKLEWDYDSNITSETAQNFIIVQEKAARDVRINRENLMRYDWKHFKDQDARRQIQLFLYNCENVLTTGKYVWMEQLVKAMIQTYEQAKILKYNTTNEYLIADEVYELFFSHNDLDELKYYWQLMKEATGPTIRQYFTDYSKLLNESAHIQGYKHAGEMWLAEFEKDDIQEDIDKSIRQMTPLYKHLHAYVLNMLRNELGESELPGDHIPMHMLGHIHAETWEFIWKITQPLEQNMFKKSLIMGAKPYKLISIYRDVDDFLVGLNLTQMPKSFWTKSIFERKPGRILTSMPKAYDFYQNDDYRIIHTADTFTKATFNSVFMLMGRIVSLIQRSKLPAIYRTSPNPGFIHFGDFLKLAFSTSKTFLKFKYIESNTSLIEDLNLLYFTAVTDIPTMFYAHTLEKWRHRVFSGEISLQNMNCEFWKLINSEMGVEAPLDRSEDNFDVGTKQQILRNMRLLRNYVSHICSYQLFRSLCEQTGEWSRTNPKKPLYMCNLQGKKEVGNLVNQLLAIGMSKPFTETLALINGDGSLDATAVLDYYQPLLTFLEEKNRVHNISIGWSNPTTKCV